MTTDTFELPPLPEPDMSHQKARDDYDEECSYSAEAVREYARQAVLMERKRSVRLCEEEQDRMKDADKWGEANAIGRCLEAIRKGQP